MFEKEIEQNRPLEEKEQQPTDAEDSAATKPANPKDLIKEVSFEELEQDYRQNTRSFEVDPDRLVTAGVKIDDPRKKAMFRPRGQSFSFTAASDLDVNKALMDYQKRIDANETLSKEEMEHMFYLYHAALTTVPEYPTYIDYNVVNERDAKWRNGVLNKDGRVVGITVPQDSRPRAGEAVLGGVRALDLMTESAGLGRRRRVSLPHTGIWMSFKTPSLDRYLELTQMMSQDKVTLGRETRGAIFSSESVYIHEILINYALSHVIDTNAPSRDVEYLKGIIKQPDLITIIWALMCTHWPNGYRYRHVCGSHGCTYTAEDMLNVARLYWVDNNKLSEMQRNLLTTTGKEILTEEKLSAYQSEMRLVDSHRLELPIGDEETKYELVLKIPSIGEDIVAGHRWVDSIETISVNAFQHSPLRGNDRIAYINQQANATELVKYAHWIDKFEVTDADNNVTEIIERKVIEDILVQYSSDTVLRELILNHIRQFISESVIAVVGYPNFRCPKCGQAAHTENSEEKLIAPIDVINAFFIQCQEFLKLESMI